MTFRIFALLLTMLLAGDMTFAQRRVTWCGTLTYWDALLGSLQPPEQQFVILKRPNGDWMIYVNPDGATWTALIKNDSRWCHVFDGDVWAPMPLVKEGEGTSQHE